MIGAITRAVGGFFLVGMVTACSSTTTTEVTRQDTSFQNEVAGTVSTRGTTGQDLRMNAYLTGYSYWDNTPRGSRAISKPVIHRSAGGSGTFRDPITIAVGHVIKGRKQTLDYPAGTKFYIPKLQKYAIVEDVCGDGHNPQAGPCHAGHRGLPWLDIWVDGRRAGDTAANTCMNRLTGVQTLVMNPHANYPVTPGSLAETGCQIF